MTVSDPFVADRRTAGHIKIHGPEAFAAMRRAGRLTAELLDLMADHAKPGVTTWALDRLAFEFAMDHKALPATLHYRGYRHSICTSIDDVVCHGIPNEKPLREGMIVNIDATLIVDGWHGDSSRMYAIGQVKPFAERLIRVTYDSLMRGIEAVRPGGHLGDIGHAIQTFAERERCSVVRDFCGHGIGRLFHDEPNVLHYGHRGEGPELKPGMIFTIEPMINLGGYAVKVSSKDGWTAKTRDGKLSAQFEHTVGVTSTGVEIFTLSPRGHTFPPYAPA